MPTLSPTPVISATLPFKSIGIMKAPANSKHSKVRESNPENYLLKVEPVWRILLPDSLDPEVS
jgi:hypothetical protein